MMKRSQICTQCAAAEVFQCRSFGHCSHARGKGRHASHYALTRGLADDAEPHRARNKIGCECCKKAIESGAQWHSVRGCCCCKTHRIGRVRADIAHGSLQRRMWPGRRCRGQKCRALLCRFKLPLA